LKQRIEQLENRLEALGNQQKKDRRNSSKPPSGGRFGKRTQSLHQKGKRSSGGQSGHFGSTLDWGEQIDPPATANREQS
jgi:transposase